MSSRDRDSRTDLIRIPRKTEGIISSPQGFSSANANCKTVHVLQSSVFLPTLKLALISPDNAQHVMICEGY